jgi:hypothetical protein
MKYSVALIIGALFCSTAATAPERSRVLTLGVLFASALKILRL